MTRFEPRRLLTDAALALALLAVTLAPGFASAALQMARADKPTDSLGKLGIPADAGWWLFAGLIVAGLSIRRHAPATALVLTAAGAFGHLRIQTKFQLLDLALPLMLYTVASVARKRRLAFGVLGLIMALTYLAMLAGRIGLEVQQKNAFADKQALAQKLSDPASPSARVKASTSGVSLDALVDTGQSVLEMWLLSVAAFAVGDSVRSRRAHLATVEQRTADLAREERQRAALAVAAERTRITRELHDVVAHGMSVMVVQAQGAAAALERHPDRAADALRHVIEIGRSSLAEMRRLLVAGRTEPAGDARLSPLPGIGDVPGLVDELRSAGMTIELDVLGEPDAVPASVDLSAYRIVQEGLTNALKHAGPGAVTRVALDFRTDCVRLEVSDNGIGPPEGADATGNGLRGIAERVAVLGGDLETGPGADGSGFRLAATLPLATVPVQPVPVPPVPVQPVPVQP
jgi:signal transduction histidine kinase